jgi:hypothetical protein
MIYIDLQFQPSKVVQDFFHPQYHVILGLGNSHQETRSKRTTLPLDPKLESWVKHSETHRP